MTGARAKGKAKGGRGNLIDMAGQRLGALAVLTRIERAGLSAAYWRCRCSCGKETVVAGTNLRNGKTRSCGAKSCRVLSS